MAGPKQKTPAKKSVAVPSPPRTKSGHATSIQKRAARDVPGGPSAKRIERSINEGTTLPLSEFRDTIDWS